MTKSLEDELDYLQYYNEGEAMEVRINNAQNWMFEKIRDFRDRMVSIQLRAFGRYNLFEASRLFSENGVEFSGGEKQRLGIARAVYKDARILVLDEPAASLDVKIEEELYRNFHSMTQGKISLTVSHRLSQASVCNKIFVLDKGVICEEGTHRELMDKCGVYAAMFRKQREAYIL